MKTFSKILAALYAIGAFLHLLDLFDLRLRFSEMDSAWRAWIVYLLIFDSVAAVGVWRRKRWGYAVLLMVALSQLFIYTVFNERFGNQHALITFHLMTISLLLFFARREVRN